MTEIKRVRWLRAIVRGLLAVLLLVLVGLVVTPTGRYLLRAGWEEGRILVRRRPIADLVADQATPAPLRAKLRVVQDARVFARESLGLTTGESFTTYSALDRDTLVLVLSGAYRDRLKRYTWWFPVVGRVPYKGYFDFVQAKREEQALTERGFDAHLGPASAFSTLGWFNDPLLPTTLSADSLGLANTVLHELTHNTYYAPGGAVFNESFANFVGARGAERFYATRGQVKTAAEVAARWDDEKVLGRFWNTLYGRVDTAFIRRPGDEPRQVSARIAARDSIYANAREELVHDVGPRLHTISIRSVERVRMDNAVLMARRVYQTDLDLFDAVLRQQGGDLRKAIIVIVAAAKTDEEKPFEAVRRLVTLRP